METNLSQDQIESYAEQGFLVVEDFLSAGELARWRAVVVAAVEARGARLLPDRARYSDEPGDAKREDYYSHVFLQRVNLWQDDPAVKELILDERIGGVACELAGVDGVRVWHDQALWKAPWANPTGWHLDVPYWSFDSRDAISIWIALDDATVQNGCLYFLPGTHRLATTENVHLGPNLDALFAIYPDWARIEPVAAPMKAGSCSFHNGLTAHAAGPNMTPRWRRAMTCGFMPDGCTFNGKPNILPHEMLATLTVGDALASDTQNPVVGTRASRRG